MKYYHSFIRFFIIFLDFDVYWIISYIMMMIMFDYLIQKVKVSTYNINMDCFLWSCFFLSFFEQIIIICSKIKHYLSICLADWLTTTTTTTTTVCVIKILFCFLFGWIDLIVTIVIYKYRLKMKENANSAIGDMMIKIFTQKKKKIQTNKSDRWWWWWY